MEKKITAFSFSKTEPAVSEIVGTLILIVIAVSTFSAVSMIILALGQIFPISMYLRFF